MIMMEMIKKRPMSGGAFPEPMPDFYNQYGLYIDCYLHYFDHYKQNTIFYFSFISCFISKEGVRKERHLPKGI